MQVVKKYLGNGKVLVEDWIEVLYTNYNNIEFWEGVKDKFKIIKVVIVLDLKIKK